MNLTVNSDMANTQRYSAQELRLVQAAHEFEGQMMTELLAPLTKADDGDDGQDNGPGGVNGSSGALGEFASEALGQALSVRGGFGIADRILREISVDRKSAGSSGVTKNRNGNTVVRVLK
jgi:Rod binding domain-containing protein